MKRIYLDVAGKMHSLYGELMNYPPEGYEFVSECASWDKKSKAISNINVIYSFQKNALNKLFPVNLLNAYLEKFKKIPGDVDLTYSAGHLIFREEPWVVDMESVTQLAGGSIRHLRRYKKLIEKVLSSEYCKKVVCWTDAERKTFLANLNCKLFEEKIKTVNLAVHKKGFIKTYNNENKVRLLFVNSANIPRSFDLKGGKEVLEAFSQLNHKYDGLELVIRSHVPRRIKKKYEKIESIKIIEEIIPWRQLEQEFRCADIFLFPAHTTPAMAILDAMSYELPVITTDVRANSELVNDGETGFVIEESNKVPYYLNGHIPNWGTSGFDKAIQSVDPKVVRELVEKASILIEDTGLRRRMGRAGRREIEKGKFSIGKRNEELKKIFDEVIS